MNKSTLINELKKGIIAWYDFRKGSRVLYIGEKGDPLSDYLTNSSDDGQDSEEKQNELRISVFIEPIDIIKSKRYIEQNRERFDYIICIKKLEYEENPTIRLAEWRQLLKKDGICIVGMNNRLGIRYFCGDRDPHTNRNFDGIEAYRKANLKPDDSFVGRCYSKFEIKEMFNSAGYNEPAFFSVLSDLDNPAVIYTDGFIPKEDLVNRIFPAYVSSETVFIEEEPLYRSLIENDIFHQMANAYLVIAGNGSNSCIPKVLQVTSSMGRSPKDAMLTIIRGDGKVLKKNAYPEGRKRLEEIFGFCTDLKSRGIRVVDMKLTDEGLIMPYIDAPVGQLYLKRLLYEDKTAFLQAMDEFRDEIMKSSDIVDGNSNDENGLILEYGYLDMVPLNSFYIDGHFVFFDQEFRREKYPANVILTRMIATFYSGNNEFEKILPQDELYKRYGLLDRKKDWLQMEWDFLEELRNEKELSDYHKLIRKNIDCINSNRNSINFPADDKYRVFISIFDHADDKKLIVFGSGKYANRFLSSYGNDYPPFALVDNSEKKWGSVIDGVEIHSPEMLSSLEPDEYKVMICIKDYIPVINQLRILGVRDYSVFNPEWEYPREIDSGKPYHIGYCAGAFDMFHIGHLNLLRRAKERCDYLIAGVMSDERMYDLKKKYPVIPCNERMQVVAGCRYVDRVEELPADRAGIMDAWNMFHYDCMFSGDDHANDPGWLAERENLRKHGSDIVFVSYTKEQSSSAIREKMKG